MPIDDSRFRLHLSLIVCLAAICLVIPSALAISTGRVQGDYITSMYWNTLLDAVVVGDYVYCGTGPGLAVIDLTDPARPAWAAEYYLGAAAHQVLAVGNRIYLTNYANLFIFDISVPTHPNLLGHLSLGGALRNIAVSNETLIAADYRNDQLVTVDVSNPNSPAILSRLHLPPDLWGVAIHDNTVYAAVASTTLLTIDISEREHPLIVGEDSATVRGLVVDYPYLYGFQGSTAQGLLTWNVSDPSNPRLLHQYPGNIWGVMVEGDTAYVQEVGKITALDISEPSSPQVIAQVLYPGLPPMPEGLLSTTGQLVSRVDRSTLTVRDMKDPLNGPEIDAWRFDNFFTGLKAYKENLFAIMSRSGELHAFDIRNRESPSHLGVISEAGFVHDYWIRNDTLYACGQGAHVIDISDLFSPRLLSELNRDSTYASMQLMDSLMLVSKPFGMHVISFRDLGRPEVVGTFTTNDHTYSWRGRLELNGRDAYLDHSIWVGRQDQKTILIKVDVSDPTAPRLADQIPFSLSLNDFKIRAGTAYVTTGMEFLYVLDLLSNPQIPQTLDVVRLKWPITVVNLHENLAFLGRSWEGLFVVDLSDPARADTLGRYDPGAGGTGSIEIADGIAYIAASHGLVVSRISIQPATSTGEEVLPEKFHLSQNYPNPFNAGTSIQFTLPEAGDVLLTVFDVLGRHVVTLADSRHAPGNHMVTWHGRNSQGQWMGSGVYFLQLRFGDTEICRKMLLLK